MDESNIKITVKFTTRSMPITVSHDSTVQSLKTLLLPLTSILPRGQTLIFKGRILENDKSLRESGIVNGARIMLVGSKGLHQGDGPKMGEAPSRIISRKTNVVNEKKEFKADKSRTERWKATNIVALAECNLKDIPDEVWPCAPFIRILDISHNFIQHVPDRIDCLTGLRKLSLDGNGLSDESINWRGLTSLKLLQVLSLSQNCLNTVPSTLGLLTSLQQLHVANNKLTALPIEIGNLTELEVLKVNNNRISSIPSNIGNCTSLIEVDFSSNHLSELPEGFCSLHNLKVPTFFLVVLVAFYSLSSDCHIKALHLSNNAMTSLPNSLFRMCAQLSTLDLHNTEITMDTLRQCEGWEDFDERRRAKHQKQIDFRVMNSAEFDEGLSHENFFGSNGNLLILLPGYFQFDNLHCMGSRMRVLTGAVDRENNILIGSKTIPEEYRYHYYPHYTHMPQQYLSDDGMEAILLLPLSFARSTTFMSIRSLCRENILLKSKQLPHEMLIHLPQTVQLISLCFMTLGGTGSAMENRGNARHTRPVAIAVEVDISSNLLSELPDEVCSLHNLKALYLSNYAMKSLPNSLFRMCAQLSTLDLHNTEITIDTVRQCEGWEDFDERRSAKHQKQIDFRFMNSAEFDEGGYTPFEQLHHTGSKIWGKILKFPDKFASDFCYFSKLISSILSSIGNRTSLIEVDLSSNHLSELSDEFCSLHNLKALHISNNAMKSLPNSLFTMCAQLSTLAVHNTEITTDTLLQCEGWEDFEERRHAECQRRREEHFNSAEFDELADTIFSDFFRNRDGCSAS
ncbi:hypothetical protein Patl1_31040 [Pistacia atlantica]|uniref:Uncharacterized protein n=1 Tax=Pistacia atlantica TaxID=434234 RepID=A0ACC1ABR5_9ROSI|nr:hypothetical protein Patl1_31040 [Pistacia atlantica]